MTVNTTLSLTDKVGEDIFASHSAAVAVALEQMIRDEEERELALGGMAEDIRMRLKAPRVDHASLKGAFAVVRARLQATHEV